MNTKLTLLVAGAFALVACGESGAGDLADSIQGADLASDVTEASPETFTDTPADAMQADVAAEIPEFPAAPEALGGERPAKYVLPADYNPAVAWPLVVLLHGYGASAFLQDTYLGVSARATEDGFITLLPDGTIDSQGMRFWNATPGCCDFDGAGVDDVGYVLDLIAEVGTYFHVDPRRVYLFGHSNGGFLSHRIACERGEGIAGVLSLAGTTFASAASCPAAHRLSLLHVHGTADDTISYDGGLSGPGAVETVQRWAAIDGCGAAPTSGEALDIDPSLDGAETKVEDYPGCADGTALSLWTIVDGTHIPPFSPDFARLGLAWLLQRTRP